MSNIAIQEQSLTVKEYNGQRVVTFADIDRVHNRPDGTAGRNFRKNRKHFAENIDFFKISPDEFRRTIGEMDKRQTNDIYAFTLSGYLMLAKSFTDELSWDIQRALVNSYFAVKTGEYKVKPSDELRRKNVEIREQNAKIRTAQLLYKIADKTDTDYKQVLHAQITRLLTGEYLLPLPAVNERTYSATEIGDRLGVSAHRIGMLANAHGLKTSEFGKFFYDKAKTADKQVETFRYYEKAVDVFRSLISAEVVA